MLQIDPQGDSLSNSVLFWFFLSYLTCGIDLDKFNGNNKSFLGWRVQFSTIVSARMRLGLGCGTVQLGRLCMAKGICLASGTLSLPWLSVEKERRHTFWSFLSPDSPFLSLPLSPTLFPFMTSVSKNGMKPFEGQRKPRGLFMFTSG